MFHQAGWRKWWYTLWKLIIWTGVAEDMLTEL